MPGLSDEAIQVRVAQRAAVLRAVAIEEGRDREQQFNLFYADYAAIPDVKATLANATLSSLGIDVTEQVKAIARARFTYTESPEYAVRKGQLRLAADAIIPLTLNTNRWSKNGCCDCEIHHLYVLADPSQSQTFDCKPCAAHEGLTTEEVHDEFHRESLLRGNMYRMLQGLDDNRLDLGVAELDANGGTVFKKGIEFVSTFVGIGKDRTMECRLTGVEFDLATKAVLAGAADATLGAGMVTVK